MNESINNNVENKNILFATGNVSQEGYPTAKCIFVKPGENRSDELKDKPLYLVSDMGMESPYFVVTPNVLEALGRVDKTSLGVISLDDRILVPMNNSSIVKITDEYYECNKASSVYEIEEINDQSEKEKTIGEGDIRIVPKLIYSEQNKNLKLEIRIGRKNLYKIKSLPDFFDRMIKEEEFKYGANLEFKHTKEAFIKEDLKLLEFIMKYGEGQSVG